MTVPGRPVLLPLSVLPNVQRFGSRYYMWSHLTTTMAAAETSGLWFSVYLDQGGFKVQIKAYQRRENGLS